MNDQMHFGLFVTDADVAFRVGGPHGMSFAPPR